MRVSLFVFLSLIPLAAAEFPPGDVDGDGSVTLADGVVLARAVVSRSAVPCAEVADLSGNGLVNFGDAALLLESLLLPPGSLPPPSLQDPVPCPDLVPAIPDYTLRYLFLGDSPPPTPFPGKGPDPTDDGLGCAS